MLHYIEYCKICGDIIGQCRCPSDSKEKIYGICSKCDLKNKDQRDMNNEKV